MSARQGPGSIVRRLVGWPLVVVLAAAAFVLGYLGFQARLGDERSVIDLAYLSLQLFTIESGNAAGASPPITLEIARFLAPATTAYALGRALMQVFRDKIEQWRLRRKQEHVVVVGLGWLGLELVERLIDGNRKVVAVSIDLDDEAVASVRRSRVPVVIGDARDPDVLREARAPKASHVVVLAGDDEVNAEVALALGQAVEDSDRNDVVCLAHIRDPQFCQMLRTDALSRRRDGFRLEFFNVAEEAAAIMLDEHATFLTQDRPVLIGVIGGNDVAAAVISETSRVRLRHGLDPVGIISVAAGDLVPRLEARFPRLLAAARVETMPGRPESLDPPTLERLAGCDVVFVCLDQDTAAIATTLEVADRVDGTPVVVGLGQWTGMSSMLSVDPGSGRTIHPFLIPSRLLEADLLLAGLGERLAREAHSAYVAGRTAEPGADADDPALADWRDLHEAFRDSSRAQVSHLGAKLQAIGCGLAPLVDWEAPPATLTDDEIEQLAILEHERWVAERLAAKWRKGDHKDPDRKISPYLVAWDDLDEEIKELDRVAARAVPVLVAAAGYRLVRARNH